jgi:inner membrane transporter RhtA
MTRGPRCLCDQLTVARLACATYAPKVSLLPTTATFTGVVVLAQMPTMPEVLASHWSSPA